MAWAKFPTRWIHNSGLKGFSWKRYKGDATAALLVLIALCIQRNLNGRSDATFPANDASAFATYDQLQSLTGISRAKLAAGLRLLIAYQVIKKEPAQSMYSLPGVSLAGDWAKLPQAHLMTSGSIDAFQHFTLRGQTELDALKLYMLLIAMRSSHSGFAHIGHDKLVEYTGVQANKVKRAKSFLIANDLIHVENDPNATNNKLRPPMRYSIRGL